MVNANIFLSKRLVLISGVLTLVFQLLIGFILRNVASSDEIILQQITLNQTLFLETLVKWGPDKINIFISHYYLDFIYPFIYAYFLGSCISILESKKIFILLPTIAGILDLIENASQLWITLHNDFIASNLFYIGAYASRGKWLLIGVSLVIIFFALIRFLIKPVIKRVN